jgi:hypothetical protein
MGRCGSLGRVGGETGVARESGVTEKEGRGRARSSQSSRWDGGRGGARSAGERRTGGGRQGGGGSRGVGVGEVGERTWACADGRSRFTEASGWCRFTEDRTRGGSLPLTALIGSIDYIDELKDKINLVSRLREF